MLYSAVGKSVKSAKKIHAHVVDRVIEQTVERFPKTLQCVFLAYDIKKRKKIILIPLTPRIKQ